MIRLVKEIKTTAYFENSRMVEVTNEYHYDTEEERAKHKLEMEAIGFVDSGQVKKDINYSFSNPKFVWFGSYYKQTVENNFSYEVLKQHGIKKDDVVKEILFMEKNNKKEVHNNSAFTGYSLSKLKELLMEFENL